MDYFKKIEYPTHIKPEMIVRRILNGRKIYKIINVIDDLIIKGYNVYLDDENRLLKVTINGAHHPSLIIPDSIPNEEFLNNPPPAEGELCMLFDGLPYTDAMHELILNFIKCYEWGQNSHWRTIDNSEVEYVNWGEEGEFLYNKRFFTPIVVKDGKDIDVSTKLDCSKITVVMRDIDDYKEVSLDGKQMTTSLTQPQNDVKIKYPTSPNLKGGVNVKPGLKDTRFIKTQEPREISTLEKIATIILNDFRFVKKDIGRFIDHIRSGRRLR